MSRRRAPNRKLPSQAELVEKLRASLPVLRQRYAIRTLALFGSYTRGEAGPGSNLVVLVEFDRVPSLFKFLELERQLTELVGVKVDLVMKDALKPVIGERILAELVPV